MSTEHAAPGRPTPSPLRSSDLHADAYEAVQGDCGLAAGRHRAQLTARWLSKPLCCKYVLAEFKTLRLPVRDGAEVRDLSWRWAFGLFKPGEYEVLGAWPVGVPSAYVADDLRQRGVERLTAISADVGMDCASTFPHAVCWSSVSETNSTSVPAAAGFGRRRRAALRSAAATAHRMQVSITRAIKRRGPFADEAAAAAFLAQTLERADRRLYGT